MPTSLKDVCKKIETLKKTSSTLEKTELLKEYLEDNLFRKVIILSYTSTLSFHIQKFPEFNKVKVGFGKKGFEHAFEILLHLSKSKGADDQIKKKLFYASSIDQETYEVVQLICNKDLKCGIGEALINKARPGTVKVYSYMRCATSKHLDKIDFSNYATAEVKADGAFANCFITKQLGKAISVQFRTREGKRIQQLDHIEKGIIEGKPKLKFGHKTGVKHSCLGDYTNRVMHGELRVLTEHGTLMSRKQGNGYINKCIHGTCEPNIAKRIMYTVWDCVPLKDFWNGFCDKTRSDRFYDAATFVHVVNNENIVRFTKFKHVNSLEEALVWYREKRAEGEEGIIIKNIKGIWEHNDSGSQDCVKIKHSFECELRVVGFNYGKKGTKYEKYIGSLQCRSQCGKLEVDISGLTDEERKQPFSFWKNKIVSVDAESVSSSKVKDKFSLYSPSLVEQRFDKSKAHTYEEIIAEQSKKMKRSKSFKITK
jgi:DNA ligase-1